VLPDRLIIVFKQDIKGEDQTVRTFEDQRVLTLPPGAGGVAF